MQEALTEQYNDQLRELREAGLVESAAEFREIVRKLRDEERAPLDAMQVSWRYGSCLLDIKKIDFDNVKYYSCLPRASYDEIMAEHSPMRNSL